MSIKTNARGKTVYGQGSFAPTRGAVSAQGAMGYVKREQNKQKPMGQPGPYGGVSKVGSDGQSDTRSGVAAGMLARRPLHNGPTPSPVQYQGFGGQTGTGASLQSSVSAYSQPKPPANNNGGGSNGNPAPPTGGNNGSIGGDRPAPTLPPAVTVNEAGQLKLPYNEQWSMGLLNGMQDMNGQLLELQRNGQMFALEHAEAMREGIKGYDKQKRGTLNRNAANGTAFSSAYGYQASEDASDFNTYMGDLNNRKTMFEQNMHLDRNMIENAFNNMLRSEVLRLAAEAEGSGIGAGDNGGNPATDGPNAGWPTPPPVGTKNPKGTQGPGPWIKKGWKVADRNNDGKTTRWEVNHYKENKKDTPKPPAKNTKTNNNNKPKPPKKGKK